MKLSATTSQPLANAIDGPANVYTDAYTAFGTGVIECFSVS